MPQLRLFAPDDDGHYILASSAAEPSLVIDRKAQGACRIAEPAELNNNRAANKRAKSIKLDGVVGLLNFPDERGILVVTETAPRPVASERGVINAAAIVKVVWLPLLPPKVEEWQPPTSQPSPEEKQKRSSAFGAGISALSDLAKQAKATATGKESSSNDQKSEEQKAEESLQEKGIKQRQYLKDFLEAGDMYVCDLRGGHTHTLQRRAAIHAKLSNAPGLLPPPSLDDSDERFVWNFVALSPLVEAGSSGPWITPIMQAAIFTEPIYLPGGGGVLTVSLISRRSSEHAGTRFKTRGLNDAGAAANFVETEQVLHLSLSNTMKETTKAAAIASHVFLRGSCPLFWEQRGMRSLNPKPKVSRVTELAAPALRVHLDKLIQLYGPVLLLSLLEETGGESELHNALSACMATLTPPKGRLTDAFMKTFDFHHHTKASRAEGIRVLVHQLSTIEPAARRPSSHGFFTMSIDGGGKGATNAPHRLQTGITRVNCLDCLNRTNMAMTVLALSSASDMLRSLCAACEIPEQRLASGGLEATLQAALRKLWTETGDLLSIQYTGTANLSKGTNITGDTPRKSFVERASGFVEKGVKTAERYVKENFMEDTKQAAIDSLLGGGSRSGLRERGRSASGIGGMLASDLPPISMFVGTWNVNGKVCTHEDLMSWLTEVPTDRLLGPQSAKAVAAAAGGNGGGGDGDEVKEHSGPGMYVVGFQEFVDLDAKNLLGDHAARRRECAKKVEGCLERIHGEKYIEVGVEQMFGVFLLVYVRPSLAGYVRGVYAENVKCGFGSEALGVKAGNKGGVAVRLEIGGASLCIINSHLPAGQKHPEERNATYAEYCSG